MAPEHLEALAEGNDDQVDHRADLFSLGVLLFENPDRASSLRGSIGSDFGH